MTTAPLKVWVEHEGHLLRLRLARPKANVVDAEMIAALDRALADHLDHPALRAVLLDADGPHFSFGASVEEHLPAMCAEMLTAFHGLILRIVASPVPVMAAVQGRCLGGGLRFPHLKGAHGQWSFSLSSRKRSRAANTRSGVKGVAKMRTPQAL